MCDNKKQIIFRLKMIDFYQKCSFQKNIDYVKRGQFPILKYISTHNGCSQINIAKDFNFSAPAITKAINRLLKANLIMKKEDACNKRANLIYITDEGLKVLKKAEVHFHELDEKTFKGFSNDDYVTLKKLLDKILENYFEQKDLNEENAKNIMSQLFKEEDTKC